jgi:hypothetical protein
MQFLFLFTFLILFFQILSQNYSIDNIQLNWIDNDDSINITLTNVNISANNWFAFGLSNDQQMVIYFQKLKLYLKVSWPRNLHIFLIITTKP